MSIQQNIEEVASKIGAEIEASAGTTSATALALHEYARAAIISGGRRPDGSIPEAWIAYMKLFAKSTEELARLLPTDGSHNDPIKEDARAYLVAGGMCTPGSTMQIADPVTNKFDQ